jgi:hypothetical protein
MVFVANLIDYFSHPKPSLYIHYLQPDLGDTPGKELIERKYNTFFKNCIEKQKER